MRLLKLSKNPKGAICFSFECNPPKLRLTILIPTKKKISTEKERKSRAKSNPFVFFLIHLLIRLSMVPYKTLYKLLKKKILVGRQNRMKMMRMRMRMNVKCLNVCS